MGPFVDKLFGALSHAARREILIMLRAADLKAGEIAEAAGLDKKEVDKAMKVLKTEGKIESPKVCYWQPK